MSNSNKRSLARWQSPREIKKKKKKKWNRRKKLIKEIANEIVYVRFCVEILRTHSCIVMAIVRQANVFTWKMDR